jgi:hypothetical protein
MTADDRAGEALEHVQRAVLEMIQAARSTLDLVEDLVSDPQSLSAVVSHVAHLAQAVMTTAGQQPASAAADRPAADRADPAPTPAAASGGVQRIPVS